MARRTSCEEAGGGIEAILFSKCVHGANEDVCLPVPLSAQKDTSLYRTDRVRSYVYFGCQNKCVVATTTRSSGASIFSKPTMSPMFFVRKLDPLRNRTSRSSPSERISSSS